MLILLADDERLVRLGLKSMLEELYPNEHTYIEATNGIQMIEIIKNHQPHIAFVDIKMPLMDGLTGIEHCKKQSPHTQWLLLTGYASFEYASQALRLGACDYLLKPISLDILSNVIEKTRTTLLHSIRNLNASFSSKVLASYQSHFSPCSQQISPSLSADGHYQLYLFYIDTLEDEIYNILIQNTNEHLQNFLVRTSSIQMRYTIFFLTTKQLCLVTQDEPDEALPSYIYQLVSLSPQSITAFSCSDTNLSSLFTTCYELLSLASLRTVYQSNKLLTYTELLSLTNLHLLNRLGSIVCELSLSFSQKEEITYKNLLTKMSNHPDYSAAFLLSNQRCLQHYLTSSMGLVTQATDYKALQQDLLAFASTMYWVKKKKAPMDLITQVECFIQENYMKEIGINTLSELYDISPNYLSKIFHEQVGKKFIDYLTETRILNAKKLFATGTPTVKEVATQVGYISTRHFSKMFTKVTGTLPSEYQEQLARKLV